MIQKITIPAINCICDRCRHQWLSIAIELPACCPNRDCRSREWNGKKKKRAPARLPSVELPKPQRIKQQEGDDEF